MNFYCRQFVFAVFFWLFSWGMIHAQAEFNIKTGPEAWSLKDEKDLGPSRHPGQMIGFDVFLPKDRFLFVPGFHYHRISVLNEEGSFSFEFGRNHHMHYFTIPITFGYQVVDESIVDISLLAGGEINFFYDLDDNNIGLDDDMFYGVSTALTGIFHTEFFSIFTLEVKYHYALQPVIKIREDSKLRGWTFAVGVKF